MERQIENNSIISEDRFEQMMRDAYQSENVPTDVNIRLQNQLKCKEVMQEGKVSFWWMPALLSTVIAVATFAMALLIYVIIGVNKEVFVMPNLLHAVTTGWLKIQFIATCLQIVISWVATFVGLWKMNFYQSAHIL